MQVLTKAMCTDTCTDKGQVYRYITERKKNKCVDVGTDKGQVYRYSTEKGQVCRCMYRQRPCMHMPVWEKARCADKCTDQL